MNQSRKMLMDIYNIRVTNETFLDKFSVYFLIRKQISWNLYDYKNRREGKNWFDQANILEKVRLLHPFFSTLVRNLPAQITGKEGWKKDL